MMMSYWGTNPATEIHRSSSSLEDDDDAAAEWKKVLVSS
jgi:hypothetical protein